MSRKVQARTAMPVHWQVSLLDLFDEWRCPSDKESAHLILIDQKPMRPQLHEIEHGVLLFDLCQLCPMLSIRKSADAGSHFENPLPHVRSKVAQNPAIIVVGYGKRI